MVSSETPPRLDSGHYASVLDLVRSGNCVSFFIERTPDRVYLRYHTP